MMNYEHELDYWDKIGNEYARYGTEIFQDGESWWDDSDDLDMWDAIEIIEFFLCWKGHDYYTELVKPFPLDGRPFAGSQPKRVAALIDMALTEVGKHRIPKQLKRAINTLSC